MGARRAAFCRAAVVLALAAGVLQPLVARATPGVPASLPTAQLAADAAWSWFSEPRSVQSGGRTYLGWVSSQGDIVAGSYDQTTHRVQTSVLMTNFQVDDHNNPSVLVRPDGRITMFWTQHSGGHLWYRTTTRAGDISAWGPLKTLPTNTPGDVRYTYANPVLLPAEGNRLYLFFRGGNEHAAFAVSNDLGETWQPARTLIEEPGQRPYVKYASNGRDTIAMAFTNGHPAETHSSIYYVQAQRGVLSLADGRPVGRLGTPLRPAASALIYQARPGEDAWVHDVAFDAAGRPRIVFTTIPGTTGHAYWYAAFDGKRWNTRRLTDAGGSISPARETGYSGGISLDHRDPSIVYLSRPGGLGSYEIERWQTPDAGRTWTSEAVTTGSIEDNVRPVVPRGYAGQGPAAIWMHGEYGFFTAFATGARADQVVAPVVPAPTSLTATVATSGDASSKVKATLGPPGELARLRGMELTLMARPVGWRRWTTLGTAVSDSSGGVSFRVPARRGVEYQVRWPGDQDWQRAEATVPPSG